MAENETENATAVAEPENATEEAYQYSVKIEDAGPATKKVVVEIPGDRIEAKLAEQFKELRQQAAIPGFRVGHAPAKARRETVRRRCQRAGSPRADQRKLWPGG